MRILILFWLITVGKQRITVCEQRARLLIRDKIDED